MNARHARRRPRLLHQQDAYVFNGAYQHRFVQAPILTWPQIRRRAAIAVAAAATAFLLAAGLTAALLDALWTQQIGGAR